MPNNLFALVGDRASTELLRVQLSLEVQGQLSGLFLAYRDSFYNGIEEENAFSRDWNADEDELLYFEDNAQIAEIAARVAAGALALDPIEPGAFQDQNVRALIFSPNDDGDPLFIQYFYNTQHLSRRGFTLWFDGETFTHLDEPGFTIGSRIDAIYTDGKIKFRNFNILKRMFDVLHSYVEASDEQIEEFAALNSVLIEDVEAFKAATTQTTRKLLSAISAEGTLENVPVEAIQQSAQGVGLDIVINAGRMVFPTNKTALKQMLRFLDHGIYNSPLAPDRRFMANSKRQL